MSGQPASGRQRVEAMLDHRPVDRPPLMPITMMFAARQVGARYLDYVTDYRILVEGQIATAEKFGFDYVTCCSDPARETADCGGEILFHDDQPPAIVESGALLHDKSTLGTLEVPEPREGARMSDRVKACDLFRQRVGQTLFIEGWVEGPVASACDLRGMNTLMLDFVDDAVFVRDLFEFCLEMESRFARAQVEAGADEIGIGDAAASLVGPGIYEEFVWPYEKRLVDAIKASGARVRLHICGNTTALLEPMFRLGCDIVDLDHMVSMSEARRRMGDQQVLLGNIDPVRVLRNGTPEQVMHALAECHAATGPLYIAGAGCEIPPDTPAENVLAMEQFVQSVSPA